MKLVDDRPTMFAQLRTTLFKESLDAVKLVDSYDKINEMKDPVNLWKAIVSTHAVNTTSRVPAIQKAATRDTYHNAK